MKHTKKMTTGGTPSTPEVIPQEAQNTLLDRKEEMGRKKFEEDRKAENEAPRKSIKNAFDKLRDMLGLTKTEKKANGGSIKSSASKRGDGCAQRGKTKGRMV
jgi:hypothetical protein